ncbi:hypothetical protein [uncultured phage cr106_1]|uniref:Uncharacterized protein n=1 Tax=uncultured phage cr106_1 TaxID=2772062 RepID=A0A7M1RVY4_9CAUD|nr:hypothetical protein KNV29_gp093 [uncultured phage cr106_1]QOR58294.1 hypothetical protein [uncultured phage cr106_1]
MEEVLVSLETAKLLKEKGFNVPCRYCHCKEVQGGDWKIKDYIEEKKGTIYESESDTEVNWNSNIYTFVPFYSAPTQSLAQKWLRDVHKLIINVIAKDDNIWTYTTGSMEGFINIDGDYEDYPTYEEALETALQETLKYI